MIIVTNANSSFIGFGAQYSFSTLNYTINPDGINTNVIFTEVGLAQNSKTYSHDYGFSLFYDDADEFDYVYNTQLRVEYYRFYIPFEKTNNAIKGNRAGLIFLLSYDIVNYDENQFFIGINSGFYYSKGKDTKHGYKYITLESPLGIIIGDKYKISDFVTLIGTLTFNFYTNLTFNNIYAEIFNSVEYSSETFVTKRKEVIFGFNCAYQL
ncbi:MAG: hypothetical protein N3F66_10555 [Spirochaetes bacterium]|nr:hypothetical protein [Spirochaetota bacterium]